MSLRALRVHGPYKGVSGYERHVREFVWELHRQGVAIKLIDLPDWNWVKLPVHLQNSWFDSLTEIVHARVAIHFMMPHMVVPARKKVNVNHSVFETTRICREWAEAARGFDLTIVPTESARRAWIEGGVPEAKVRTCPYGINTMLYSPFVTPEPMQRGYLIPIQQRRVRFLNVSAWDPRKNLLGLLRVWVRATSPHDDAVLAVKLSHYSRESLVSLHKIVDSFPSELGKGIKDAAAVVFIGEIFSDAELPRLYASFTHYISMSFGEGWDQPMVEAAASGLRLIAPNHSAYPTYLDSTVAHLIPSREIPAVRGDGLQYLFEGSNWWAPDEEAAAAFIRSAIDGEDHLPSSARDRIFSEFTWERATGRLIDILEECEAIPSQQRIT